MRTRVVQRLRITFGVDGPLCYVSVLDMGRLWERLLRRADVPLAYTQGFNPHPRMQFAAALPVGYSSQCELLDILIAARVDPPDVMRAAASQAPIGLTILRVEDVPLNAVHLQGTMRWAHYRVRLRAQADGEALAARCAALLASASIIRQRMKKGRLVAYDLRPLIRRLSVLSSAQDDHELLMVLRHDASGAGRPEEVVDALGLHGVDVLVQRTRLIWDDGSEEKEP